MLSEAVEDQIELVEVLILVSSNLSFEISVLKLLDLVRLPTHWHIAQIDNLPEWIPKRLLAYKHMMHHKSNHFQIFCVKMILVNLRMSCINGSTHRITAANNFIDYQLLRYEQKCLLRWDVLLGCKTNKLTTPAKSDWIINMRMLGTMLLKPGFEMLILLLLLQFCCFLSIYDGERIDVLLLT